MAVANQFLTYHGQPLTPSRIVRGLRARLLDRFPTINSCDGIYESFEEAARAAPRDRPLGYDDANSATWYQHKLKAVQLDDYPVAFWLRKALEDSASVFEVGGHVGEAYYSLSQIMSYPEGMTWTICEVPSTAEAGERLAHERGCGNLKFVTRPEQCAGAEIFIACGSLQYLEAKSPVEIFSSFDVRPRHIIINTTPIYDGPGFITLQYIGTAYCPYRIFNRQELLDSLSAEGYTLVASWQKERAFRVRRHPERSFDHYSGLYLRKA